MDIAIIEKNNVYRESLKVALNQIHELNVIIDTDNCLCFNSYDKNKSVDLILLDCKIVSENNFNFLTKLKEQIEAVKIVILADYPQKIIYHSFYEMGADKIIFKHTTKKIKL